MVENVKTEDLPITTNTSLHIGELANPEKLVSESQRKEFVKKDKINNELHDIPEFPPIEEKHEEKIEEKNTPQELTPEEEKLQKMNYLRKLAELQESGIRLSQVYNINSNLDSMKLEYDLHKGIIDKKNGVSMMVNVLVLVLYTIEYSNDKFNPFKLNLSGWATSVNSDLSNYYNIFEEIYEKYTRKGNGIAPEVKLLIALSFSALTFHVSHSIFKNKSDLGAFGKDNPELVDKMRQQAVIDTKQFKERQENQHEIANMNITELDALRERDMKQLEIEKNMKQLNIEQNTKQMEPPQMPPQLIKQQPILSNMLTQTSSGTTKTYPMIINRMKHKEETDDEKSESSTTTSKSTVSFNKNMPDIMKEVKEHKKEMEKKEKKEMSSIEVSGDELKSTSISIGNIKKKNVTKNIGIRKRK
jgi:hypothetical protein